ncbi:MAG: amino acid ABC transporter substrate-binding protein, partial [Rhodococcus sp.]|nr:amino acid ABC transporter substrate-binding protein [Rhodococcus sp. (in: high G+C Gram-positive bacteria)]
TVHAQTPPIAYTTMNEARAGLIAGDVDALILDLPTGLQLTEEVPEAVTVGQFSRSATSPDRFGLVLELDSRMTTCVSIAVETLYDEGVLDALAGEWLTSTAGVRVLD